MPRGPRGRVRRSGTCPRAAGAPHARTAIATRQTRRSGQGRHLNTYRTRTSSA
ncbi:MAG: hypothetical protein MZV64_13765 [Ignavibacteriales bacterium]|nr:hypothetical protein [Ignavibacteriales bacterium]